MFSSFSAALSALKAHAAAVDAVGHNLANLNTTGFKATDVAFKDLVAASLSGGQSEKGMGVGVPTTVRNFSQGAVQSSSGALDAAIEGNGFFVVDNANGQHLLTRDGSFTQDASGYVVTTTGQRVQQYNNGVLSDILIPTGAAPATPTSVISMVANLNANAAVNDTFSAPPVEVVDSLGNRHLVTFTFTKTAANSWDFDASVPAADLGTGGSVTLPSTKTLKFDASGKLTSPAQDLTATPPTTGSLDITIKGLADSANDIPFTWNLYDSTGQPSITQYSQSSAVTKTDQNGYPASQVTSVGMAEGGKIMAKYGNGQQKAIATLAIALVANPSSLQSVSDNNFAVSPGSAAPVYGTADSGGRGKVDAGALESSTVDMAKEFTNLIVYQRGYQANSKVITTSDEMSQETLNLKR